MGRRKARDNSDGNGLLSDLFENRKKRAFTLSVDEETYVKITQVAEQMGVSRPKVLMTFVKNAYDMFVEEAGKAGLDFDPDEPLSGNHKWRRESPPKKKTMKKKS